MHAIPLPMPFLTVFDRDHFWWTLASFSVLESFADLSSADQVRMRRCAQLLREQLEKPNRLNNRSAPSSLKRLFPLSIIIIQVAEESIFGVEQHFQARVRRFSLYEPTLNHWITHLLFSYLANWRTKAHKNVTVTVNRDSYRIIWTPLKSNQIRGFFTVPSRKK